MIKLTKIRELTLRAASAPGRLPHLSAASGLVRAGGFLYVVADDELSLGVFPASGTAAGDLIRLFPGELPPDRQERKARKPDLETLVRLPACVGHEHGALLALPSGSRPNRHRGALLALDDTGAIRGAVRAIDCSGMYARLADAFRALNIEGLVVVGDELQLLQRANKRDARNARIRYSLSEIVDRLQSGDSLDAITLGVDTFDLGGLNGVPLGFSDGAALPNGEMIFTAVAESTEDGYEDAPCAGAAIGICDRAGRIRVLEPVAPAYKIEGIDARVIGPSIHVLLVTDADDASVPASLLTAELAAALPSPAGGG